MKYTNKYPVQTQTYSGLLYDFYRAGYKSLDDDQIAQLVGLYLSKQEDGGETVIKEETIEYHLDIIGALAGRLDAIELQRRLLQPLIKTYKEIVLADYDQELCKCDPIDDEEEKLDFIQRGADVRAQASRSDDYFRSSNY